MSGDEVPIVSKYSCRYCQGIDSDIAESGIRDWEYGVEGTYEYRVCRTCNGVQLYPFPDLEDLKRAYDIDYHGYADKETRGSVFAVLYWLKELLFRRKMRKYVGPGDRVLDVGCGAGEFLLGLRSLGVTELEGIDFNAELMARLREQGLTTFAGTFPEFSAPADSYDMISMNNYLEHTLDPAAELEKSLELLRSGRHLVGEVPGFASFDRMMFGRYWGGNHVPRHTFQFTPKILRTQLLKAGFEDIRITHELNTSHWALSVQNFLQRAVPDLRNNPAIEHGRGRYYLPLVLLFIPVNLVSVLLRKSGCIKFYARKPRNKPPQGQC